MTLSYPSLSISLLASLVLNEELLAYQFAFDLVEGAWGSQEFLETMRSELPEGDEVSLVNIITLPSFLTFTYRNQKRSMTNSEQS